MRQIYIYVYSLFDYESTRYFVVTEFMLYLSILCYKQVRRTSVGGKEKELIGLPFVPFSLIL